MRTDLQPIPIPAQPASLGEELLRESLTDYVASLKRLPAICGTSDQQEELVRIIAEGNKLIKLVSEERLKITREIDKQKQVWMNLEKKLIEPIEKAMAPYKNAVHTYNVEQTRLMQEAKRLQQETEAALIKQNGSVDWLAPVAAEGPKPKGVQMRWSFEVVDSLGVPLEFLMINESAVKEAIRSGVRKIPGLRIYQEPITTY
ncbi:hypothetical protein [Spirosoma sp.]|uniref:hypothetical protein n=1 Tax=Spirosoma sp. TaxID=1899569 RepID=UPI003B3BC49A